MAGGQSKYISALWGGIFIVVFSVAPGLNAVNCMCCSGVVGGGVLAVYLQSKKGGDIVSLSALQGVELGLLAGLFGTILSAVIFVILSPFIPTLLSELDTVINEYGIDELGFFIDSLQAARSITLIAIAVSLVLNVLFATIGGLIGVSLFGGKHRSTPSSEHDYDDAIIVEDIDFE